MAVNWREMTCCLTSWMKLCTTCPSLGQCIATHKATQTQCAVIPQGLRSYPELALQSLFVHEIRP